ncbi:MAG: hypothetical protein IJY36_01695 [Coprobacter sp.]|nr:hypothetical protein [Coprobacter sp.]
MKKITSFAIALTMACGSVFAQDPVHGVDGYYNYTPTQMQAEDILTVGGNGKKFDKKWHPEVSYTEDMQYVKLILGANETSYKEAEGGYNHRSSVGFKEKVKDAGVFTITKKYPVLAFKVSIPYNNEGCDTTNVEKAYWEPEFKFLDKTKVPLNGLDNNGRNRFIVTNPAVKGADGRDTVYFCKNKNSGHDFYRVADNVTYTGKKDSIWHCVYLDKSIDEKANVLVAIDFSKVCATPGDSANAPVCMLDTMDITLRALDFMSWINVYADTLWYDADSVAHVKTKDQMPYTLCKWVKTFESMEAFDATLNAENNWGDGPTVDPNKPVLNAALYEAQNFIAAYKFSDKLNILQNAYDAALAVYNNPASTGADYETQVAALTAAKEEFTTAISYKVTDKMNKFYFLTGMALGIESEPVTIGNYTGYRLTAVEDVNAVNFYFTEAGISNGQTAYNLKDASTILVQASDGTLLMVDASQAGNKAALTFGNRGQEDNPGFDIKCGKYYYYFDSENGLFTAIEEIPTVEEYDELADYLFYLAPADAYDPNDHNSETHPMTSGEGSAWEFNGEIEMALEPAYKASFEMFEWDADAKAIATARATIPYAEGWSTSGWRLGNILQINKEHATTDGQPLSCLRVNYAAEVDDIHTDTLNNSITTTDYVNGGITLAIMREHGAYTSAANRVPQPNQLCDSLYAINLNSGINRYFAMKFKTNNEALEFGGMVFFVLKGIEEPNANLDNLLEKRGDVYVWDLLECGIPYGDRKACAQYLSWKNVSSDKDAVYIDWIRFYDSLDAIPTETMEINETTSAIKSATTDKEVVETVIYSITGNILPEYTQGVNIVKVVYTDGTCDVKKVIK